MGHPFDHRSKGQPFDDLVKMGGILIFALHSIVKNDNERK